VRLDDNCELTAVPQLPLPRLDNEYLIMQLAETRTTSSSDAEIYVFPSHEKQKKKRSRRSAAARIAAAA